jgi:hypothetical protein
MTSAATTDRGQPKVAASPEQGDPFGAFEGATEVDCLLRWGTATDELYAMRDDPSVAIRVAAFLRRALGRTVDLREQSGFLEPYVRLGNVEYSLIKDEGHGLPWGRSGAAPRATHQTRKERHALRVLHRIT